MDQEKIGQYIKQIRIENKLTQKEFANLLGVTYQAVSKWENGKNLPDIATLQVISEKFNVDINDLLSAKKESLNKKKNLPVIKIIILIVILILIVITSIVLIINHEDNFEFKTITTNCKEFEISGSAAYNKDKTSIYISHIDYCGELEELKYNKIECLFYEEYEDVKKKISNCSSEENNITLSNFLKNVKINVDNYTHKCKNFSSSKLYIEINATNNEGMITTYKIPIELQDNC